MAVDFEEIFKPQKKSTWDNLAEALSDANNMATVFNAPRKQEIAATNSSITNLAQMIDTVKSPEQMGAMEEHFNSIYPSASKYSETLIAANTLRNKIVNKRDAFNLHNTAATELQNHMSNPGIIDDWDEITKRGYENIWREVKDNDGNQRYGSFAEFIFDEQEKLKGWTQYINPNTTKPEDLELMRKATEYQTRLGMFQETLYGDGIITDDDLWFIQTADKTGWGAQKTAKTTEATETIKSTTKSSNKVDTAIAKLDSGGLASIFSNVDEKDLLSLANIQTDANGNITSDTAESAREKLGNLKRLLAEQKDDAYDLYQFWNGTQYGGLTAKQKEGYGKQLDGEEYKPEVGDGIFTPETESIFEEFPPVEEGGESVTTITDKHPEVTIDSPDWDEETDAEFERRMVSEGKISEETFNMPVTTYGQQIIRDISFEKPGAMDKYKEIINQMDKNDWNFSMSLPFLYGKHQERAGAVDVQDIIPLATRDHSVVPDFGFNIHMARDARRQLEYTSALIDEWVNMQGSDAGRALDGYLTNDMKLPEALELGALLPEGETEGDFRWRWNRKKVMKFKQKWNNAKNKGTSLDEFIDKNRAEYNNVARVLKYAYFKKKSHIWPEDVFTDYTYNHPFWGGGVSSREKFDDRKIPHYLQEAATLNPFNLEENKIKMEKLLQEQQDK